jgi:hypothetical protein
VDLVGVESKNGVGGELPEKDCKSAKYQVLNSLQLIID